MQKPIRTLIALLAAAAIVLSFAACGKTSGTDATDPTETAESVSASDTSAAPSTSAPAGTTAAATPADAARAALSEAIAGARAYYDSIKNDEAFAQIADDLDTRLQRAEALLASSSTTADALATAASDVAAALSAAKEQADAAGNSAAEDGQNPVMNYVGDYECDRCSITIEADGDTDAKITVHWGSSATEATVWTMSGRFDPDTKRINYSDSTKTVMNFEGEEEKDTVVYENGVGRIQFLGDGKLEWQDEQEIDTVRGMVFESIG